MNLKDYYSYYTTRNGQAAIKRLKKLTFKMQNDGWKMEIEYMKKKVHLTCKRFNGNAQTENRHCETEIENGCGNKTREISNGKQKLGIENLKWKIL